MGLVKNLLELLPVIVVVHDAWHTPTHYSHLIDELTALGYPIACPSLPTMETEPSCTAGFNEDCSLIYQLVFDLCSDGNDVVVLGHGYGAFIASEAIGELGQRELKAQGKPGGVIGFAALAGLLPEQGQSLKDVSGGTWPNYIHHEDSRLILLQPETTLYNDLGPMSRKHWASHLVSFASQPCDIQCQSAPAWSTIPSSYILCDDDHFVPEALQRKLAQKVGGWVVNIEGAGHDPFIRNTEDVVNILGSIVTKLYMPAGGPAKIRSRHRSVMLM